MPRPFPARAGLALCVFATACTAAEALAPPPETSASGGADAAAPSDDAGGGGEAGSRAASVVLRQAVSGVLLANPDVYAHIPVRVAVEGAAEAVDVSIDGTVSVAEVDPASGDWVAAASISGLALGAHALVATARTAAGDVSASAELIVGREGTAITVFSEVGVAGTPAIHRAGADVWVTWTDERTAPRAAWLQRIDGAGRPLDAPRALVAAEEDVLNARAAMGQASVGVLYQLRASPYANFFTVVDLDGEVRVPPIALDPAGWAGGFGGAVVFDGHAFTAVSRANQNGEAHVRWIRVDEQSGAVAGPVTVVTAGPDSPDGSIDPFTFLSIAAASSASVVGFVRKRWDAALGLEVPRAQLASIDAAGAVGSTDLAAPGAHLVWDFECRAASTQAGIAAVWAQQDLTSEVAATAFFATKTAADGTLDPARGAGVQVLAADGHRSEPHLVAHPRHAAVLAWLDERSYAAGPNGRIELFVAPLDGDFALGDAVVFPHARFIEGTSELNGTTAGDNVLLVWLDERHGAGLASPKPEVWFETAWY